MAVTFTLFAQISHKMKGRFAYYKLAVQSRQMFSRIIHSDLFIGTKCSKRIMEAFIWSVVESLSLYSRIQPTLLLQPIIYIFADVDMLLWVRLDMDVINKISYYKLQSMWSRQWIGRWFESLVVSLFFQSENNYS